MKVRDNRAISVMELFRKELEGTYSTEEIETFIFFSLNEYAGFSRSDLVLKKDTRFSESELLKFFRVIRKLKQHIPLQYIFGHTQFYGLDLKVNEHVLIPRPETEELVEWIVKEESKVQSSKFKVLDIGTGSGCIAIALKKNIPNAEVFAMDISENALAVAKENAEKNQVEIQFIKGNILNHLTIQPFNHLTFDIIVSNPPYITEAEKEDMHKNVLEHEPHTALFVPDNDALLFYRAILDFAKDKLAAGGKIYFELNAKYADAVKELAESKGFVDCEVKKDLSGKERMMRCGKE
jgi:release factor glutamine methyltransferase